ncbi:DUF805 domain-containing protein [Jannaschia sp. W003]|uniref:DUF805 domain-containing protein n=1 Tax=Jannaschia sp. W003 TaxID=2867012 RepID=UPI0021A6A97C|nr:DUF805 domain-containing protein [Jannaschia sp. W003]UWQ20314.1 DUF805 domain-containing protein [Jannaschia sp. W003]
MGPIRATILCLSRPHRWTTRAPRSEFWGFVLVGTVALAYGGHLMRGQLIAYARRSEAAIGEAVATADPFALLPLLDVPLPAPAPYVAAAAVLPLLAFLAAAARRLHDTGRGTTSLLLMLVPVIGPLWLALLLAKGPEPVPNRWGGVARGKPAVPRGLERYMTPKQPIDVHDTPEAVRALRQGRMPKPVT